MVINLGHQTASVTPVIDGYVLHGPSFNEKKFGGQHITHQLTELLVQDLNINISIPQQIISKEKVELMAQSKAVLKPLDKYTPSLVSLLKEVILSYFL